MVLALVVGAISGGQITGKTGYYTPLMLASAVMMPIGAGLITTFNLGTGEGKWIGYQILFGFSIGIGMQQGSLAAQTVLDKKDVPTGVSLMFFCQMLAGAIFVSVGQNVWASSLVSGLIDLVSGLNPEQVVNTGATDLRTAVPSQDLEPVLRVYNSALRDAFIVALAMGCISIFGALAVEWRSVKGKQGPSGGKRDSKAEVPAVKA